MHPRYLYHLTFVSSKASILQLQWALNLRTEMTAIETNAFNELFHGHET